MDGANERVKRAGEHLLDLKQRVNILRQEKFKRVVIKTQRIRLRPPLGDEWAYVRVIEIPPSHQPMMISILVGEIIYNMRAALDYLVYELACFDTKKIIEKTQFLIEDTPEGFLRHAKRCLNGLNPRHLTAIENLQPFKGCDWTERLRDISNPDKHMRLIMVDCPVRHASQISGAEAVATEQSMNMNDIAAIEIVFRDGMPIIETLEQLKLKVAKTLRDFNSEF
ncbi:hypothetical protein ACFLVE_03105 [Chloroflexota bacterium]